MATDMTQGLSAPLASGRPDRHLPTGQLVNLSVYWLGITAIWAGLGGVVLPHRMEAMFGIKEAALYITVISAAGVIMPILVQPITGSLSDYTTTRWGRRKPYIAVGAVLDVVFLYGLASSNVFLAILAFYVLLQFSSNLAQGPFQGYMPDLVPESQVGGASGMIGLMVVIGQVTGVLITTAGIALQPDLPADQQLFWPTVGLGVLELVTALVLIARVDNGPPGVPRDDRTWGALARSTWGRDVLAHRSFVWLVLVRLAFLAAIGVATSFALYFLQYSLHMSDQMAAGNLNIALVAIVIPTALTVVPAARISDRWGRKRVIYAACGLCIGGLLVAGTGSSFPVVVVALIPTGIGAGAFLAVDWALMTDIIPKASAGRYMGFSNVGTALAGPVAIGVGGIIVFLVIGAGGGEDLANRLAVLSGVVFGSLAALCLTRVDPTPQP